MALQRQEISRINPHLVAWVDEVASRTRPDSIYWCDGSQEENSSLVMQMLKQGMLIELDQDEYPDCYLYRSHSSDVARTESSTFICTDDKSDAGPTNNWMQTDAALKTLWEIFDDSMKGRTMYVVPYIMGPVDSPYAQFGVEITDSPYVVISLRIMTRMGSIAMERLGGKDDFVRGIHSMGTLDPGRKYICHFPETKSHNEHKHQLWRKRAALEKVAFFENSRRFGQGRGMDGGAHADNWHTRRKRGSFIHYGSVSERQR